MQQYLHPFSEHLIDWFHITMRLTVLQQQTKALQEEWSQTGADVAKETGERETSAPAREHPGSTRTDGQSVHGAELDPGAFSSPRRRRLTDLRNSRLTYATTASSFRTSANGTDRGEQSARRSWNRRSPGGKPTVREEAADALDTAGRPPLNYRRAPRSSTTNWRTCSAAGTRGSGESRLTPDFLTHSELDDWLPAAAIDRGRTFRRVNKVGRAWGEGMRVKAVWHIVKESARSIGVAKLAPHDLPICRTCARLCHASGGELEQIQFLLGHVSVQTTSEVL